MHAYARVTMLHNREMKCRRAIWKFENIIIYYMEILILDLTRLNGESATGKVVKKLSYVSVGICLLDFFISLFALRIRE
jgi:hypothetical protein